MERLVYEFEGDGHAAAAQGVVLVGVVGSGNLEVMIEPAELAGGCSVTIDTTIPGYGSTWQRVVDDFFKRHALKDARISINDGGATPAVVILRLDQAAAEFIGGSL